MYIGHEITLIDDIHSVSIKRVMPDTKDPKNRYVMCVLEERGLNMSTIKRTAKLDSYDYDFKEHKNTIYAILITLDGYNSVEVADIVTDINVADGHIYVEGHYFKMMGINTEADIVTRTTRILINVTEEKSNERKL